MTLDRADPAKLRSQLAAEFERRGWQWDRTTAPAIISTATEAGEVDAQKLSTLADATWLAVNNVTRDQLARAIELAIGHLTPAPAPGDRPTQVVNITNSTVTGSNFSTGAITIVNIDSGRDVALDALRQLVASGLHGQWDARAAQALADRLDQDDITDADVVEVTNEVVATHSPSKGRVKSVLGELTKAGIGGTLARGMWEALNALL